MPLFLLLHFGVTCALTGLIWTIQVTHYPLFAQVGPENFAAYHEAHTRTITCVVGPLMLAEVASAGWLWLEGRRDPLFLISLGFLAAIWLSTALIQIPLHHRLAGGFAPEPHANLVLSNWIRTLAWTARALLLAPAFLTRS